MSNKQDSSSWPHENDLVFRRDAIEAIIRETNQDGAYGYGDTKSLVNVLDALPSVQSKPLRINLNEWVKVKLTDLGKEIYYHQFDELNNTYGREIIKPSFPSEDKDGYTRFQLWEFMQLYGPHIGMGAPNVIDPLEIVYEGENQCAN